MQLQTLTCSLALASAILALPTATRTNTNTNNEQAPPLRATRTLDTRDSGVDLVIAIMPSSTSCAGRGDECVTADVAAPLLANGLAHYGVTTGVEQAGILALVAFESVEMQYKYNTNADAAAGGKGTSNQQSGGFNVEFANTFDELSGLGLTESNVLDYVTKNKYNFWTVSPFSFHDDGIEYQQTNRSTDTMASSI